jgi:hypothetical protein
MPESLQPDGLSGVLTHERSLEERDAMRIVSLVFLVLAGLPALAAAPTAPDFRLVEVESVLGHPAKSP